PRPGGAADHQPAESRPGVRPRLRAQRGAAHAHRCRAVQLLRLRRHQRIADLPPRGLNVRKAVLLVLLLLLTAAGTGVWLWQDFKREMETPMALSGADTFKVTPGMNLRRIAAELERRGWMEKPLYFVLAGRLQDKSRSIKAGEFSVQPGTTPQ